MSQENRAADPGELTRRLYETADRGDFDAMVRLFRPGAVWDLSDGGIGTFEGATAIRRVVEDWQKSYEDYKVAVEEIVDLGKGVTLAVSVQTGRPTGSPWGSKSRRPRRRRIGGSPRDRPPRSAGAVP